MLSEYEQKLCDESRWDFTDLRAMVINCTLKPSPGQSHTQGLLDRSIAILERNGVTVDLTRAVDHDLPPGVYPDMRDHGFETDGWPDLAARVMAADILVLGTPIWLGEKSSVCTRLIERLYGNSAELNDAGQYAFYGRVGGSIITGNEDGAKHCSMNPRTSTTTPAARRTTSRTATPRSRRGTSCTWPASSRMQGAFRRTATSAPRGMPDVGPTSTIRNTDEPDIRSGGSRRRAHGG